MNTGDHDLEKLLGKLAPAPPPEELMERLRAARPEPGINPPVSRGKVVPFGGWLAIVAAAAACVAVAFTMQRKAPTTPDIAAANPSPPSISPDPDSSPAIAEASAGLVPLETRQHLMEVTDYGIVEDKAQRPVRLIGTTWVDEIVYAANGEGKPVTESRVRQEILPVSVTAY